MTTASTAAGNARKDAGAPGHDDPEAARDSAAQPETDLAALRREFNRLAAQVADLVAGVGNAGWRHAKSNFDEALAEAEDKGQEAVNALREVSDRFVEALDQSIKTRPYATLAIVAGIAFLFGATWRR
jgi:ElaB/YqjD/DUF883 family membrane-anchored ribosome-binding protein